MTDHTDGETIQSSWAYDKNDRALYVMQDGKIMGFGYNGVGEMTSIRYSAGNTMEIEGAVRTVTYEYDELGRLTAVKRGEVDTSNETMAENVKTVKDYSYTTEPAVHFCRPVSFDGTYLSADFSFLQCSRVNGKGRRCIR